MQTAQAVHAAFHFFDEHTECARVWLRDSNFLVVVAVPDVDALLGFAEAAQARGIRRTLVIEPDLDDEPTALALAPCDASRRLCANLPLALREVAM